MKRMPSRLQSRETSAEKITRTAEDKAIVEHDNGDKFEMDFKGGYPETLRGNPSPPGRGNMFKVGISFSKDGKIKREGE